MAVEAGICGTWVKTGCESPIVCEGCCCCAAHCSCRQTDIKTIEYMKGADGDVHVQLNDGNGNTVNLATIRNGVELNTTPWDIPDDLHYLPWEELPPMAEAEDR